MATERGREREKKKARVERQSAKMELGSMKEKKKVYEREETRASDREGENVIRQYLGQF